MKEKALMVWNFIRLTSPLIDKNMTSTSPYSQHEDDCANY